MISAMHTFNKLYIFFLIFIYTLYNDEKTMISKANAKSYKAIF